MAENQRPKIKVRFKYNIETGEVEEFIVDDNAPFASEEQHDQIARIIAQKISCHPDIYDAGMNHHLKDDWIADPLTNPNQHKKNVLLHEKA